MIREATRRGFLKKTAACGAAAVAGGAAMAKVATTEAGSAENALPRWRGFNMLSFFQAFSRQASRRDGAVPENELRWIRDWGFDFVRIPMDYWLWVDCDWRKTRKISPADAMKIKESALESIDRTVELGRRYGLHVSLNFHRAPGYCINDRGSGREPFDLWKDKQAEDTFVHHWDVFAKRYRDIGSKELSFNLVNEAPSPKPGRMERKDYCRVMTRAVKKIRRTSPDRLIFVDGYGAGSMVVDGMIESGVAQSVHAYRPGQISHYRAKWVDRRMSFPKPTWPLRNKDGKAKFDRAALEKLYAPWGRLVRRGIGVHCGECGCYNKTPHDVFLAWFQDVLSILTGHGIGWALWNLRGSFGVVDSGRADVDYKDFHGHKLDKKLLDLLKRH